LCIQTTVDSDDESETDQSQEDEEVGDEDERGESGGKVGKVSAPPSPTAHEQPKDNQEPVVLDSPSPKKLSMYY
jgi:hypothetical protein